MVIAKRATAQFGLAFALAAALALGLPLLGLGGRVTDAATDGAGMEVYKSPTCSCCAAWIEHASANGLKSMARNLAPSALQGLKEQLKIKPELRSCHTALIDGYVIEGHVPASDIKRLLAEKPDAIGLAVPGMPVGSPGMEGETVEKYDVLLLNRDGSTAVYSKH